MWSKRIRRESIGIEKICGKEAGKGMIPFGSKMLVKSVIKDRRDKFRNIEISFKELEKGRGIVEEHIPAV